MLTKDFLKHLALPALEPGHTLAHPAVELPKVVLNLAKISQQSARGVGHLQKPLLELCIVQYGQLTLTDLLDLCINGITLSLKLSDARCRIGLGAADTLQIGRASCRGSG